MRPKGIVMSELDSVGVVEVCLDVNGAPCGGLAPHANQSASRIRRQPLRLQSEREREHKSSICRPGVDPDRWRSSSLSALLAPKRPIERVNGVATVEGACFGGRRRNGVGRFGRGRGAGMGDYRRRVFYGHAAIRSIVVRHETVRCTVVLGGWGCAPHPVVVGIGCGSIVDRVFERVGVGLRLLPRRTSPLGRMRLLGGVGSPANRLVRFVRLRRSRGLG